MHIKIKHTFSPIDDDDDNDDDIHIVVIDGFDAAHNSNFIAHELNSIELQFLIHIAFNC